VQVLQKELGVEFDTMFKKTKAEQLGSSDLLPEGVFGMTEQRPVRRKRRVPETQPKTRTRAKLKVLDQRSYVPDLNINYDNLELPEAAKGLTLSNTVPIPEALLELVKARTEGRTRALSHLILKSVTPSILACDAALSYTKAFMETGFGFSVSADSSIQDGLEELVRLEVLSYFVRRSQMLRSQKRKLLRDLTAKTAETMSATMSASSKKKDFGDKLAKLEAFVLHKSGSRTTLGPEGLESQSPSDPVRKKTSTVVRRRRD